MTDELKIALAYTDESSKRARRIVFLMQISALLVAVAAFQEEDIHWRTARLTVAQDLVWIFNCVPAYGDMDQPVAMPNTRATCRQRPTSERLQHAISFLATWGFSRKQTEKYLDELESSMVHQVVTISAPVLGFTFDVNDLSLVSGITFFLLLYWLQFSLFRQEENIRQCFELARRSSELALAYDLMVMTQVLTVPRSRLAPSHAITGDAAKAVPSSRLAGVGKRVQKMTQVPLLMLLTGAAVHAYIVSDDLRTFSAGENVSPLLGRWETVLAALLMVAIIHRTLLCWIQARGVGRLWNDVFTELQQSPQGFSPEI